MTALKKAILITLSVVAVLVLTFVVLVGIYFLAPKSDPLYVAHRGYRNAYVDNTEASFRAAAEMDYYGIETDIWKTADGVYVGNHDDDGVKYADGSIADVKTSTYAALSAKPLLNTKTNEDAYICTFETYLEVCKSGNKVAVIELKEDFSAEDLTEILHIVDEKYDRAKVSIISFYFNALLRTKQADPTVCLQYLSETKNDHTFDRCLEEKISISIRQSILTKKIVKTFHKAGLTVNTWTVNKKFDRNFVRLKGVDYITSDVFDK